jgi:hypothetical protein
MQQPFLHSCTAIAIFCLAATAAYSQARDFHTQRVVLDDNNGNKIMIQTPPGPITGGILTIPDPAGSGNFLISNPASGSQSISGDLLPGADSVFSLGSLLYRWKEMFVGGTITTTSIVALGPNDFQGAISNSTGNLQLADDVDITDNLVVGGSNFTVAGTTGNTVVGGSLSVYDTTWVNSTLIVSGAGNSIGDGLDGMQLRIDGVEGGVVDLDINGDVDISGTLTADTITINGTLGLIGDLDIGSGNFTVVATTGNTMVGGNLEVADTIVVGSATLTANSRLTIKDGHWTSQQTTAPSAAATGTGVASASMANETDVAGLIEFTTNGTPASGAQATVTFDAAYSTAPIIVVTPANAAAAGEQVYVTRTTGGFTINFVGVPAGSTSHEFLYQVIETQ